jgi:hypothetical protein
MTTLLFSLVAYCMIMLGHYLLRSTDGYSPAFPLGAVVFGGWAVYLLMF